jgi:hypothetical protein
MRIEQGMTQSQRIPMERFCLAFSVAWILGNCLWAAEPGHGEGPTPGSEPGWHVGRSRADIDMFVGAAVHSGQPRVVIFSSSGCGPCRQTWDSVATLPRDMQERVMGVPIDEEPVLAAEFSITTVPTLVVVAGDGSLAMAVGGVGGDDLARWLTPDPTRP